MNVNLHVDVSKFMRFGANLRNQIAFALADGINKTALQVQSDERANVKQGMEVRKPDFILRQVAVIKPFASATQGRPYAEVSVGQKPRLLLSQLEEGGTRDPFKGKNVAVPITGGAARPAFAQSVVEDLTFRALRFHKERRTRLAGGRRRRRAAKVQIVGAERTYIVRGVGVFQRTADGSRLLYKFVSKPVLKPSLRFIETAKASADQWFPFYLDAAIEREIRRAAR